MSNRGWAFFSTPSTGGKSAGAIKGNFFNVNTRLRAAFRSIHEKRVKGGRWPPVDFSSAASVTQFPQYFSVSEQGTGVSQRGRK
jgi:hypothetical protein